MHARQDATPASAPAAHAGTEPPARDYLVCRVGQREYGMPLDHVQELRSHDAVRFGADGATIAAGTDPAGVIAGSLRLGAADVAVGDLGALLRAPGAGLHASADIVIIRCGDSLAAFAVDSVIDVVTLASDRIAAADAGLAAGTGTDGRREVILLDTARLVAALHSSAPARLAA